ncbi:LLM class flavin-dependent oxidoreductase [Streptomyces sp. 769]|uniref:LLM class flavin-dependent oxidoreductase n=1 Tax=Streptomyces sp. 769 TaxID=1262452 RepID=UPI00057DDA9B|nr:LLM class flavin-dependent oxidoreductase [Streptomyces sp. 769]AJC59351.1 putative FMNH2-utilizing oxygenase [Streptomyces sp. 769]
MPEPHHRPRLAVALDAPGVPPRHDAAHYTALARLAEHGTLDFVTLGDRFGGPGPDALAVLARIAPDTERIGLVPTVTTTHTEPFHVSTAVATLDWVSRGRAGWTVEVSTTEAEAALVGRPQVLGFARTGRDPHQLLGFARTGRDPRPAASPAEVWSEAGEVADVAGRLWDSWEDDAEIRDRATGRFVDRAKLHHVDFTGRAFSVRGPSIVPRPPQGRPVTVVDVTGETDGPDGGPSPSTGDLPRGGSRERGRSRDLGEGARREVAAARADVALVRAEDPQTAGAARADLLARARAHGRALGGPLVLASLPVELESSGDAAGLADLLGDWFAQGVADGFHLRLADPVRDLPRFVEGTVPLLRERGLLRRSYEGTTLREHLGLPRPASIYALAREAAR